MSESLLFAVLGFLTACLIGTVFVSFLWRRAVAVTTRKIIRDEKFADLDEVANLKADLRAAQNSLATKGRELSDAEVRTSELETALLEAQASGEGAAESLNQELQNARKELEAAHSERDTAKDALRAKDGEIAAAKERVTVLENAIRALAKEVSLFDKDPEQSEVATPARPSATAQTNISSGSEPAGETEASVASPPAKAPAKTLEPKTDMSDKNGLDPSQAVSRSLEERIEALKQGETSAV